MFWGKKTDPNRDLEKFARRNDRSAPDHFVGRADTIQAIKDDLQDRIEDWEAGEDDPWGGPTRLIQGAPGTGKSALLTHLAKTLPKEVKSRLHGKILPRKEINICFLETEQLKDTATWEKALVEALKPETSEGLDTQEHIEGKVKVESNTKVVKAGGEVSYGKEKPSMTWAKLIKEYKQNPKSFHPVLLLIHDGAYPNKQHTTGLNYNDVPTGEHNDILLLPHQPAYLALPVAE